MIVDVRQADMTGMGLPARGPAGGAPDGETDGGTDFASVMEGTATGAGKTRDGSAADERVGDGSGDADVLLDPQIPPGACPAVTATPLLSRYALESSAPQAGEGAGDGGTAGEALPQIAAQPAPDAEAGPPGIVAPVPDAEPRDSCAGPNRSVDESLATAEATAAGTTGEAADMTGATSPPPSTAGVDVSGVGPGLPLTETALRFGNGGGAGIIVTARALRPDTDPGTEAAAGTDRALPQTSLADKARAPIDGTLEDGRQPSPHGREGSGCDPMAERSPAFADSTLQPATGPSAAGHLPAPPPLAAMAALAGAPADMARTGAAHSAQADAVLRPPAPVIHDPASLQSAGQDNVELRLTSDDLGTLRLDISHTGDRLHVVVAADRAETLDLARRHSAQFLADLQGARLGGADLSFGRWREGPAGQSQDRPAADVGPDEATAPGAATVDAPARGPATGARPGTGAQLDLRM